MITNYLRTVSPEWWKNHKNIPTVEQILDVLAMNPEEIAEGLMEEQIALWYFDRFLSAAGPKDYWKLKVRGYCLLGDKINIGGKNRVNITITSEAFLLLQLENCHTRWTNMFKLWDRDPSKDIPTKGAAALPYKGKFTDSKVGQVKYGGWNEEGFAFFNQMVDRIKNLRSTDKEAGYPMAKYGQSLIRKKHGIRGDSALENGSRKRKPVEPATPAPVSKKIQRLDED